MYQFGLEKEFFVQNVNSPVGYQGFDLASTNGLPYDECGFLVEARGEPHHDISSAVFNLKSQIREIEKLAQKRGVTLDDTPVYKLPPALLLAARRRHAKGVISYRNFRGFTKHRNSKSEQTAGLHISITDQHEYRDHRERTQVYYANFDWMSIFWRLDEAFKDEIKAAKRNRGFYEVKPDGRVEYRSLPANIDLDLLIDVMQAILKEVRS